MGIIKRLFIITPLVVIFLLISITIVIPVMYWVITGNHWDDLLEEITDL